MITITTKTKYGILAILELAENYGKTLVQIGDIVKRRNVPKPYLEQILNRLARAGIVKSVRGNKGGYTLAVHPDEMTLLSVIESLEGSIKLTEGHSITVLAEVFAKAEVAVKDALNVSLSELLERQKLLQQQIMFAI